MRTSGEERLEQQSGRRSARLATKPSWGESAIGLGLAAGIELLLDRLADPELHPRIAAVVGGGVALLLVVGWLRGRIGRAERRARGQP